MNAKIWDWINFGQKIVGLGSFLSFAAWAFFFIATRVVSVISIYKNQTRIYNKYLLDADLCKRAILESDDICTDIYKKLEKWPLGIALSEVSKDTYLCGDYDCISFLLRLTDSWTIVISLALVICISIMFGIKKIEKRVSSSNSKNRRHDYLNNTYPVAIDVTNNKIKDS